MYEFKYMFKYSGSEFRVYISEAFLKHLATETISNSLHEEMNKASCSEPTGTTTSNTVIQLSPVPVIQKWGQTLSTNYSVGLNGRGLRLTQSLLTNHVDP